MWNTCIISMQIPTNIGVKVDGEDGIKIRVLCFKIREIMMFVCHADGNSPVQRKSNAAVERRTFLKQCPWVNKSRRDAVLWMDWF